MDNRFYACHLMNSPDLNEYDIQVKGMYLPLVQTLYHQTILMEDTAQVYLQRKYEIGAAEIRNFKLGFCNRQLGKQLPHHRTMEGVKLRGALSHLKVLRATGHEAFRGCVTVPVFWQDEIVGYYGERIDRARRGSSPYYWHPIGNAAMFNLENIKGMKTLFLCQSPLIAIQMMKAFDDAVIATDPLLTIQQNDIHRMCDLGVEEICVVKSTEVSPPILMQLSKRLASCGIKYDAINLELGGAYGTA